MKWSLNPNALRGQIAVVAGATRGAGRGIAAALGEAGATVVCTGRSTRGSRSEYDRPETIEETAELVTQLGGTGVAVAMDHLDPAQVEQLARRIRQEAGIRTGAVGVITELAEAEAILADGSADLVLNGRELLREPYWALRAEAALGAEPSWPTPYGYAVRRRPR